ncbi:MAG: DNA-3-methyladenine glycosylase [Eubacteriales bacterium]|nr:DNA-3-methyladenine glycosylase [Eubacteriales bacterium]
MQIYNRLGYDFYRRHATEIAPSLIGKYLCRRLDDGTLVRAKITETECYFGEDDTACHAHKGKTDRTSTLYEDGGIAYVYLCYGIHSLLNVVTGERDFPEAVLIRGVEDINGPGKLTKALKIDRTFNRENLIDSQRLWIDDAPPVSYIKTPRIGIDYAEEKDRNILWRFVSQEK